jgi:uncharacterized oxidoreductase
MSDAIVLRAAGLVAAVGAIVRAGGSSEREAELVGTNLVEANLRGHDSHGVGMVPRYVDSLREGGLAPNAQVAVLLDSGPLLRLDGRRGYGQVIGEQAMALAIERARTHGVCVAGLANAHHLGRIGQWAERCAEAGLVSIHFVNVISRPIVAPHGGRDARFGTNPFCVAVPRVAAPPIVLDFATSRIAQGKTRVAHNQGKPVDPGCLLDDQGRATTDPRYAVIEPYGALLTFGEHKGSGLALVCELLGGALAGGDTQHVAADGQRRVWNGMLSIVVDPQAFGTAEHFAREVETFVAWYAASPPRDGIDRVRVAGEPEREAKAKRLAQGIPVDPTSWEEILRAGEQLGVARAQVARLAGAPG